MDPSAAKLIGAGLASIALVGAAVGIGTIFGNYLQGALRKYPNDPSGNLRGIEAMLLAQSDPQKSQDLIAGVRQRDAANPSHHAAYFAACALARTRRAGEAVEWLREAAATGFPCYALFANDPNLDPIRTDPRFQAFMAEMQKASASLRAKLFPDDVNSGQSRK